MQKITKKKVIKLVTEVIEIKKYYCDYCNTNLGDTRHLSIELGRHCGWVRSPDWKHKFELEKRPYQFCDNDCLERFLLNGKKEHVR